MTVWDKIKWFWATSLTKVQRRSVAALLFLLAFVVLSGWASSVDLYWSLRKSRVEERNARAVAAQALEEAARIASKIKAREIELNKLEENRNEIEFNVRSAEADADRANADVRNARNRGVPNGTSADELCRELGKLGYPCG